MKITEAIEELQRILRERRDLDLFVDEMVYRDDEHDPRPLLECMTRQHPYGTAAIAVFYSGR